MPPASRSIRVLQEATVPPSPAAVLSPIEAYRRRNAALDALFYDVRRVGDDEAQSLSPWLLAEGAVLRVPPTGAGRLRAYASVESFIAVPGAWHHTNTELENHLPVTGVLRGILGGNDTGRRRFMGKQNHQPGGTAMPAKSKAQQKAAGAALAAKRGETKVSELKGASKQMYESMSEAQLEEFAETRRKGLPERKDD